MLVDYKSLPTYSERTRQQIVTSVIEPPQNTGSGVLYNVIAADHSNSEGVATALVLRFLLHPYFSLDSRHVPKLLLPTHVQLPTDVRNLLIICTNGVFQQSYVLKWLIQAAEADAGSVPVLADDNFRFPTPAFIAEHQRVAKELHPNPEFVLDLITGCFKEIAIVFQPVHYCSTEAVLTIKAKEVMERLNRRTCAILQSSQSKELRLTCPPLPDTDTLVRRPGRAATHPSFGAPVHDSKTPTPRRMQVKSHSNPVAPMFTLMWGCRPVALDNVIDDQLQP